MLREGGLAQIFFPDGNRESVANLNGQVVKVTGSMFEVSTFSCFHCNAVEFVPPKADVNAVGFCRHCMRPICQKCSGLPCRPYEEKIATIEAKYHASKGLVR